MNEEQLGTPQEFAARVSERLRTSGRDGLPSTEDFAALIDAAFFASLHEEEARRVELAIAWQAAAHDCSAVIAIDPPVRVTPKNLAKLAPAAASAIAVRREAGELVAWALLERAMTTARQPLTIRALASGVLRVELDGEARALYARGEILLDGAHSPAERLKTLFAWDDARADAIVALASGALAHGHGGMILIVPAAVLAPVGVRIHYAIRDGGDLLIKDVRDETIDLVARLTAIDNALLLDTDLRVRGFGVQVIEGDAPEISFAHVDPYTTASHIDDLSTFKGTRHPAGVLFCMRQDGAAAAVIASQDRRLSIASKDARGVVEVLGSYEHGFGWR